MRAECSKQLLLDVPTTTHISGQSSRYYRHIICKNNQVTRNWNCVDQGAICTCWLDGVTLSTRSSGLPSAVATAEGSVLGQLSAAQGLPSLNWAGSPGGVDGVVAPAAALSRKSGGGGGGSEVEVALPGVAAGLPLPFFAAPLKVSASTEDGEVKS